MNLKEIDELWQGENLDKNSLKYLCRKYDPLVIIDWIHRGLSQKSKARLETYHKEKLLELGIIVIEKPKEVKDDRLFKEEYGEYFSE